MNNEDNDKNQDNPSDNDDDDDGDDDGDDYIDENAPVIVIENPPYRESTGEDELCFDNESELDMDIVNENVGSRHRVNFSSDTVKGSKRSSQPWLNTKFQQKEEPSCSTMPIRR